MWQQTIELRYYQLALVIITFFIIDLYVIGQGMELDHAQILQFIMILFNSMSFNSFKIDRIKIFYFKIKFKIDQIKSR